MMKMIKALSLILAVAGLTTITARAVPIVGSIGFTGQYTANGLTGSDLSTATSMSINSVSVDTSSGDLAGATSPLSFASPIGVNGNGPAIGQLWSVTVGSDVYVFNVTSSNQVFTSPQTLVLQGLGTMTGGMKDATVGTWQLSFGVSGQSFTWQSTSANVPDGGFTVSMFGLALVGCAGIRRKLAAV